MYGYILVGIVWQNAREYVAKPTTESNYTLGDMKRK